MNYMDPLQRANLAVGAYKIMVCYKLSYKYWYLDNMERGIQFYICRKTFWKVTKFAIIMIMTEFTYWLVEGISEPTEGSIGLQFN